MTRPIVLLIDDEPGEQDLLEVALEEAGVDLAIEQSLGGEEALRRLAEPERDLPQLILLDLNMPGMHGLQVLEVLRSQRRFDSLPIVVYTTSDAPEVRTRSREGGADLVLIKASTLDDMAALAARLQPFIAHGRAAVADGPCASDAPRRCNGDCQA